MRTAFVVAGALLLAACGSPDQPAAVPVASVSSAVKPAVANTAPASLARYDGYGDVRFGMDEAAFAEAWRGELKGAPSPGSGCFYKTPKGVTPADIAFMFEGGRFVRYDVGTAKAAAPGGGKVGMDEAHIRALYGARIETQPHKYVSGANYLRIAAPHGDEALVFETDTQGRITRWRVGVPPQIDYVEGCG